jgi:hypothetical protein
MEALASYARQSEDEQMLKAVMRIKARAIDRCGELLREIPAEPGTRTDIEPRDGAVPRLTRTVAATEAGLSRDQAVRYLLPYKRPPRLLDRQGSGSSTSTASASSNGALGE